MLSTNVLPAYRCSKSDQQYFLIIYQLNRHRSYFKTGSNTLLIDIDHVEVEASLHWYLRIWVQCVSLHAFPHCALTYQRSFYQFGDGFHARSISRFGNQGRKAISNLVRVFGCGNSSTARSPSISTMHLCKVAIKSLRLSSFRRMWSAELAKSGFGRVGQQLGLVMRSLLIRSLGKVLQYGVRFLPSQPPFLLIREHSPAIPRRHFTRELYATLYCLSKQLLQLCYFGGDRVPYWCKDVKLFYLDPVEQL